MDCSVAVLMPTAGGVLSAGCMAIFSVSLVYCRRPARRLTGLKLSITRLLYQCLRLIDKNTLIYYYINYESTA